MTGRRRLAAGGDPGRAWGRLAAIGSIALILAGCQGLALIPAPRSFFRQGMPVVTLLTVPIAAPARR